MIQSDQTAHNHGPGDLRMNQAKLYCYYAPITFMHTVAEVYSTHHIIMWKRSEITLGKEHTHYHTVLHASALCVPILECYEHQNNYYCV